MSQARHLFVCGAQRSASTYLLQLLDSHPTIEMAKPIRPEPKVFLNEDSTNLTPLQYRNRWHKNASQDTVWFGEKSTSYIEDPNAAGRISTVFTNPKFIFVLRDPVERAVSNYHFSSMNGYEEASINTALMREINEIETPDSSNHAGVSVSPKAYLARGRYVDFLQHYFETVPAEDILLLESGRLTSTIEEKGKLFEFLGLDSTDILLTNEPVNVSAKDREQRLEPATLSALKSYFKASNQSLENLYHFDTSNWCS